MKKTIVLFGLILLLAACSPATPATPTVDVQLLYTSIASTVQFNATQTSIAQVTPTLQTTPTITPTPSLTITPTISGSGTPAAPINTLAPAAIGTATPQSTTSNGRYVGDHAQYGYQQPADDYTVSAGAFFPLTFGLLNNGTTTWTTDYHFRWLSGTIVTNDMFFDVTESILPGSNLEINMSAGAPEATGTYITSWALYNDDDEVVPGSEVYLRFIVVP
ncbi:MAG TPA: NBR1-Ig-like domain-containing protein [Longilinea sp.]|nr:NBR1-Ig-like domain-containing protein [Longilinea sp.]